MSDDTPDRPQRTALDALELYAVTMEKRQRYSERNRLALLVTHGVGLVLAAILLAVDGPARAVTNLFGGYDTAFNALPAVGGTLLLLGLSLGRRMSLEAAGMTIGLIWDVGMIAAFSYQATQGAYLPSSPIPATTYPIAVYGTLAALMGIHLYTLVAIIRDDREGVL